MYKDDWYEKKNSEHIGKLFAAYGKDQAVIFTEKVAAAKQLGEENYRKLMQQWYGDPPEDNEWLYEELEKIRNYASHYKMYALGDWGKKDMPTKDIYREHKGRMFLGSGNLLSWSAKNDHSKWLAEGDRDGPDPNGPGWWNLGDEENIIDLRREKTSLVIETEKYKYRLTGDCRDNFYMTKDLKEEDNDMSTNDCEMMAMNNDHMQRVIESQRDMIEQQNRLIDMLIDMVDDLRHPTMLHYDENGGVKKL